MSVNLNGAEQAMIEQQDEQIAEYEAAWLKLDELTYSFDSRSRMEAIRDKLKNTTTNGATA